MSVGSQRRFMLVGIGLVQMLEFHFLATSKVISGHIPICDSAHSWQLYTGAPLRKQASHTMTWYPTQSYCPDTELTSSCPILLMPSARLGNDKYRVYNYRSLVWLNGEKKSQSPTFKGHTLSMWVIGPPLPGLRRINYVVGECVKHVTSGLVWVCWRLPTHS